MRDKQKAAMSAMEAVLQVNRHSCAALTRGEPGYMTRLCARAAARRGTGPGKGARAKAVQRKNAEDGQTADC